MIAFAIGAAQMFGTELFKTMTKVEAYQPPESSHRSRCSLPGDRDCGHVAMMISKSKSRNTPQLRQEAAALRNWHYRLLRMGDERPRGRRAAEKRDELASFHVRPLTFSIGPPAVRNPFCFSQTLFSPIISIAARPRTAYGLPIVSPTS